MTPDQQLAAYIEDVARLPFEDWARMLDDEESAIHRMPEELDIYATIQRRRCLILEQRRSRALRR